jgi:hypothetical protein
MRAHARRGALSEPGSRGRTSRSRHAARPHAGAPRRRRSPSRPSCTRRPPRRPNAERDSERRTPLGRFAAAPAGRGRAAAGPASCVRGGTRAGDPSAARARSRAPRPRDVRAGGDGRGRTARTRAPEPTASARPRRRAPRPTGRGGEVRAPSTPRRFASPRPRRPRRRPSHSLQRGTGHAVGRPQRAHIGASSRRSAAAHSAHTCGPLREQPRQRCGRSRSSTLRP